MITLTETAWGGWQHAYTLTNGMIDVIFPAEVGIRLLHFGFSGQPGVLATNPAQLGMTGGDEWRIYGGHRLWHAPEDRARTYAPDNARIQVEALPDGVRLTQPVEASTGIAKQLEISMSPDRAELTLTHRLTNTNLWAVECAAWALSVMQTDGTAILPLPPYRSHTDQLTPAGGLVLWAYTDLSDPRWTWGRRYVLLRQDPSQAAPQKVGSGVPSGWVAYAHANGLFVKHFTPQPDATYPDLGSAVELFTNDQFLEVETLSPLRMIPSGGSLEHRERWQLLPPIAMPQHDADVERDIIPMLAT